VTEPLANARVDGGASPGAATAGTLLGTARRSAGLSIDAVAQQLKLAPRQVRSLEEDDYTHLPGRTFVRGFVRNYARLLHLDADKVLRALPAGAAAPALEAPTLQPTAPTMGELPTTDHSKPGWARWAIPLTLAAVVAAAAVYEWMRPAGIAHPAATRETALAENPAAPSSPPATSGTTLPNLAAALRPATESASAEPAQPSAASPSAASPEPSALPAVEQPLALTFRDYSWTEIRDRDGRLVLSGMNPGGTTQSVSGTPPFDIVIGNATDVRLTYKGRPVDLVPHTRQNVARFRLP